MSTTVGPQHFSFVLIPGFSLLAVSCAVDALRAANVESGELLYKWTFASADGEPVVSSGNIPLPAVPPGEAGQIHVVTICGGERSHNFQDRRLTGWLQQMAKQGLHLGSLSDGAFVAASAGLFDGYRSTIHWKCLDAYIERFPKLDIHPSIIEVDRKRFSCAGGTASLDLMLNFVEQEHGPELVAKIAGNFFHDTFRNRQQVQESSSAFRYAARSPVLTRVLQLMDRSVDETISMAHVAAEAGITQRQLNRLFKRHLGTTPGSYFRELRLRRAGALLRQTDLSISEIAVGCGFQSASHLARHFQRIYGQTPGHYRRAAV